MTTARPNEEKNPKMTGRENGEKKGNLISSHVLMTVVFGNRKQLPAIANY
jgi:hypothetical protein